ncbi:glycoside hydrolase family 2 [Parabacteroides goldsteinii]|uniref:glycoside hydrolase family 2 protein n=1 Tax=Parabacteroides goldsteinii TaxID=328812 RepID=UPI001CCFA0C7|nr:glycoside hydrolase family 2 TIM barrel-domain containing protein [Parabacteroides goldsteinii]UBD75413.1 glycoside hydrolase family 2 [Parabacteroides goldsteinii]
MTKIYWLSLLAFLLIGASVQGQSNLNFGRTVKQQADELPRSKAGKIITERKAYQAVSGQLQKDEEGNFLLSSGWEMIEGYKLAGKGISLWDTRTNADEWYNAVVPGTVLTTLVEQSVYPDPYYGLNNLLIPDTLCRMDWWYRISFEIPQTMKDTDYQILLNGINYKADIWLNGIRLGTMNGAFKRGLYPVAGLLDKQGMNTLAVHIFPPNNPGIPFEENKEWFGGNGGALCLDGPTFISSEGWDWIPGIRDRNIGIWQDVRLVPVGDVLMEDPQVITDLPLPDTTYADIKIKTRLVNTTPETQTVSVNGKIGDISFSQEVILKPSEQKNISFTPEQFGQLRIHNPALWWPNGYGAQALYKLSLTVAQEDQVKQKKEIRFGIRELSYELMAQTAEKENIRFQYSPTDVGEGRSLFDYKKRVPVESPAFSSIVIPSLTDGAIQYLRKETTQPENPFLTICVNGKRIFCRGGNWGMDDGMKRVTRERLEPYFRLHKEANFTMVRNWTGESTEELFYTLCDEYGLLVWNDFSISTQGYNLEPLDDELFLANARDIVLRFRNHPSIAIWCPRNEGYAPEILEDGFQKIISAVDGTRHYHGNSRDLNLCSSGPWHYIDNQLEYLTGKADGFSTELGAPSVPTVETLRKFIPEEDLWPIGDVWYYHDLHYESFDWKNYIRDVEKLGQAPSRNADEFCSRAQFINYNLYRNMFEAWNQKMWNYASGLLLWMSHPAWPSMIWQTYSYDYETHGSFYGAKKACEPIHVQWNSVNKKLQVVNTTLENIPDAKVFFRVYDLKGKQLYEKKISVELEANKLTDCMEIALPPEIRDVSLVRTQLSDRRGKIVSENDYWINPSEPTDFSVLQEGGKSELRIKWNTPKKKDNKILIRAEIKNNSQKIATGIKVNVRDKESGKSLLPVYVSDGYFNLLPDEHKQVSIEIPENLAGKEYYVSADEWIR